MNKININGNFDDFLSDLNENNYYILEEEIDIKLQSLYFKTSREVSDSTDKNEVIEKSNLLHDDITSNDTKKKIMCQLATLNDVEAFRILENNIHKFEDKELNDWSLLAYNESRMILNGSLSNEQQIFISTGLGGKAGKFRYFIVFQPAEEHKKFTEFSRKFIKKELEFTLKHNDSVIEKTVEEKDEYISFKVLIPFKTNIPKLFKSILDNCNQLTPFIDDRFIITNVNEMDQKEILEFIESNDWDNDIEDDIISLN